MPTSYDNNITHMVAPAAPLKMLHTSPTTSAHTELTLSACFFKLIAMLIYLIFVDDFNKKGLISLAVTATPIISNNTLTPTKQSRSMVASKMFVCESMISDITPKKAHRAKENKKTSKYHNLTFLRRNLFLLRTFILFDIMSLFDKLFLFISFT